MFRPYLAIIRLTGDSYQLSYKCSLYLRVPIGYLLFALSDNHTQIFYIKLLKCCRVHQRIVAYTTVVAALVPGVWEYCGDYSCM